MVELELGLTTTNALTSPHHGSVSLAVVGPAARPDAPVLTQAPYRASYRPSYPTSRQRLPLVTHQGRTDAPPRLPATTGENGESRRDSEIEEVTTTGNDSGSKKSGIESLKTERPPVDSFGRRHTHSRTTPYGTTPDGTGSLSQSGGRSPHGTPATVLEGSVSDNTYDVEGGPVQSHTVGTQGTTTVSMTPTTPSVPTREPDPRGPSTPRPRPHPTWRGPARAERN